MAERKHVDVLIAALKAAAGDDPETGDYKQYQAHVAYAKAMAPARLAEIEAAWETGTRWYS